MLRLLRLFVQFLVLVIVALASALISMRLAIHGREATVPDFRGMAPSEAEHLAFERGLELSRSDRFYSPTIPAGHIVSQQPEAGTHVRRGWHVQAAESLGPQINDIPALLGMSPRAAEIDIRRRGLELGSSAELPTGDAPPQAIVAQSPAAGATGVTTPQVSLLYAAAPPETAFVMPDLTGLPLSEATAIVTASGLKVLSVTSKTPGAPSKPQPATLIVTAQSPTAGSRVTAGTSVSFQIDRY